MSIAFNVENLGPIGQIGLDVDNVLTITRLATSAASWFTSSSQTLSLAQTISSNGASLVPASIFNRIRYNNIRQRYGVTWGAARVSGGILKRVRLSNVSTATEGDPGLICLRAIIIALLCFVEEHTIVDILKKVLPSRLFHYEQEDREIEMEGPYLAALKQHVKETVKEELRDDFRSKLLDTIDNQIHRVSNATREELLDVQYMDEWLISGLLDWALTPVATRESSTYYTRSVRVWSLALILSELGFDIQAVRTAIKEPYEDNTADISGWKISKEYNPKTKQPPRIIPIRAYPSISYSDYVNRVEVEERQPCDAQMLETAFINTFVESRSVLSTNPIIQRPAHIEQLNPPRLPEEKVFDACLHQYIEQYIRYPGTDDLDIISKVILPPMQRYLTPWRGSIDLDSMIGSKRVEWMTRTICWAVVLSVLSLFVRSTNSNVIEAKLEMEFVYTETDAREAISELLSQLNNMSETSLGLKHQSSNKWIKFVVQKMTNINTESCDECFGAQCNGLSVISEFILRPSALISSVYVLHSVRGQLLDIPTSDGFIVASRFSNYMGRYLDIRNLRPFQTKEEVISALSTSGCNSTSPIRLDVEPDWKYDPSHIELNIRTDGILRAQLSISRLIYLDGISPALYYNCGEQQGHIHHYCPGPETISELLTDDMWGRKWYYLPFQEMIRNGQISMKNPDSDRNGSNWITRIHDALTFMLALQCRDHTWTIYVTDCLGAALFYIALYDDRPVVIIIYEESHTHNRLLELGPEDPRRFHRRATELASFWIHAPSKSAEFPSPCRSRLSVRERRSILEKRMFQWILPPAFRHVLGDFGLEILKIMRTAVLHGVIRGACVHDILKALDLFNIPTSMGISDGSSVNDPDTVARCSAVIMERTLNEIRRWRTQNPDYDAWEIYRKCDAANFPLPPPPPTIVEAAAGPIPQPSSTSPPPQLKWTMFKREKPEPPEIIELPFHGPPIPAKVVQALDNDEDLDALYYDPETQKWVKREKTPEPYNPLQLLEKRTDYDESVYAFLRSLPGSRYFL